MFFCMGMVGGVSDTMTTYADGLMPKDLAKFEVQFAFCPVPIPTWGARVQAFKNSAAAHPEEWAQPMTIRVIKAMHATWPCDPDHLPDLSSEPGCIRDRAGRGPCIREWI